MTSPCPCRGCTSAYKAGQEAQRRALHDTWRLNLRLIELREQRDTYMDVLTRLNDGVSIVELREYVAAQITRRSIAIPPRPAGIDATQAILNALD